MPGTSALGKRTPNNRPDDGRYAPALKQRRRDLPGVSGLLSAYAGTAPTVTLSGANAGTSITNAVHLYTVQQLGALTCVGAVLTSYSGSFDGSATGPSSITPFNGTSFQVYRIGLLTDAPVVEFQYRGVSSAYRVWVDGQPVTLAGTALPGGGAFYRVVVTFSTRAIRRVEVETDTGHLVEICIGPTDTIFPSQPRKGIRGVVMGDSYVEGTGATNRFTTFAQTFGQLAGWSETIASGSGGTGYLNVGAQSGRVKFRDRFANDVAAFSPDVILFTGGRNDNGYATLSAIQTEATALFNLAKSSLPSAACYVTGCFPASATEAASTSLLAVNAVIQAAAAGAGFPFLDVMGANAYITGGGRVGGGTGNGNADNLTSNDGVHPSQLGHDTLARVLFSRYSAALAA